MHYSIHRRAPIQSTTAAASKARSHAHRGQQALCHCTDCKKVSGSMFSTNLFVHSDAVKLESGNPKAFRKNADSGNVIVSFFCTDCGTTLWRETTGIPVCAPLFPLPTVRSGRNGTEAAIIGYQDLEGEKKVQASRGMLS